MTERSRISRVFYLEGFSLGVLLASILFAFVELVQHRFQLSMLADHPTVVLVPAFLAAFVGIKSVAESVRAAQDLEFEKRRRAEIANRANLPNAISILYSHSQDVINWYHAPNFEKDLGWDDAARAIETITRTIEFAPEQTAEQLAQIAAGHAVQRARFFEAKAWFSEGKIELSELGFNDNFSCSTILWWCVLSDAIGNSFSYARGGTSEIVERPIDTFQIMKIVRFTTNGLNVEPLSDNGYIVWRELLARMGDRKFTLRDLVRH